MSFKFALFAALFFLGLETGKHIGYRDGVESVEFDKFYASQKLNQCLRIVRHE